MLKKLLMCFALSAVMCGALTVAACKTAYAPGEALVNLNSSTNKAETTGIYMTEGPPLLLKPTGTELPVYDKAGMSGTPLSYNVGFCENVHLSYGIQNREVFLVRSYDELKKLFAKDNLANDLSKNDYTKNYSEAFFSSKSLLVLCIPEPSGSIRLETGGVNKGDDSLYVNVIEHTPEGQTCDMAYWRILIEIDEPCDVGTVYLFTQHRVAEHDYALICPVK
jgi:hypothetical protein